jgi:hypothetical protein
MIQGSELIQKSSDDVGWLIQELIVSVRSLVFVAFVSLQSELGFKGRCNGCG